MFEFIISLILGVIFVIIGISNMLGNISSLHSYHRQRVAEEDIKPFGKKVGLGTIIIGASIVIFSILSILSSYSNNDIFIIVGTLLLIAGLISGIIISLKAINKYNKGIF